MPKLLSLVALALSLCGVRAQDDPLRPEQLVYVATLGEAEIGKETVRLDGEGWSSEGSFDLLGTRQGKYSASLRRGAERVEFAVTSETGGRKIELSAVLAGGELAVEIAGASRKRTLEVAEPGPDVFFFENLLWASLIDIGHMLARRDARGELAPGAKLTGLTPGRVARFEAIHHESSRSEQVVGDQRVALRISRVELPPGVELTLVCTPQGLPLRIEIPGQRITVVAEGFEAVRGGQREPTSIVDSGPWRAKLSQKQHEVVSERKVMVPMRDGVTLATDVFRPKGEGPFPAILARTPYSRVTEGGLKGAYYASRGYVFVAQDVRGRFDSGGEWFPFVHEERDGSDAIDWIAAQSWSDGKVGMVGASYVGLVQWLAAKSGNPSLKCIVPQVSPPDPHENFPYEGGAFLLGAAWWAKVLESMKLRKDWRAGLDWESTYATLPLGDLDAALDLEEETFLDTWLAHPPHDAEFWGPARYQHLFGEIAVPAFHVSGWYDGDMPGAYENFAGMRAGAKTPEARAGQFLVMGPWTHFFNTSRAIGEVDFGDEAVVDLDARILRFLDRYLKGIDNGIDAEDPVHVFTMGTNRWHAEKDWPLPETRFTKLYLASGGGARRRDGDGRLGPAFSPGAAADVYRYDPARLPELDIDFTDTSGAYAQADKSTDPDRDDDLEYTSPPLATDCEIVGPVRAVIWASTDARDTDFTAAIYRLTTDGKRYAMRGGIQRLRYAADPRRDTPVPPGTVTRVEIDCWATGQRLRRGDRIQLVVSSWGWPGYARNLNTLEPQLTATEPVVATNTVYHDAERPSHLLLPVIPRADAPGLSFRDE